MRLALEYLKWLKKNKLGSGSCIAWLSGDKEYQVKHMSGAQYMVDLAKHTCTCRRWDLTGIPCAHGIAAIYRKEDDPYKHVHSCYEKAAYLRAYTPYIHAMPSQEFWPPTNHQPVAPPKYHKQAGRPKKVRAREQDEPQRPSNLKKLPKCFSKVNCGMCGKKGHNRTSGKRQRQASQVKVA